MKNDIFAEKLKGILPAENVTVLVDGVHIVIDESTHYKYDNGIFWYDDRHKDDILPDNDIIAIIKVTKKLSDKRKIQKERQWAKKWIIENHFDGDESGFVDGNDESKAMYIVVKALTDLERKNKIMSEIIATYEEYIGRIYSDPLETGEYFNGKIESLLEDLE